MPALGRVADGNARQAGVETIEFGGFAGGRHDMARPATLEAVREIDRGEEGRRRNDDGAELHGRQHRLPERRDIAQHQQDAVAALHAQRPQAVGHVVRAFRQFGEGEGDGSIADDFQRGTIGRFASGKLGVEPVEGPVELVELGPAKIAVGSIVIATLGQQELSCRLVRLYAHRPCLVRFNLGCADPEPNKGLHQEKRTTPFRLSGVGCGQRE